VSGYQRVSSVVSIPANFLAQIDLACPNSKKVLSAGYQLPSGVSVTEALNIVLRQSYPTDDNTWRQWIANTNGGSLNLTFHIVCVSAP
jgi:hypothetical protein